MVTLGFPSSLNPDLSNPVWHVSKSCTYLCLALEFDGVANEDPIYSSRESTKVLGVELVLLIIRHQQAS